MAGFHTDREDIPINDTDNTPTPDADHDAPADIPPLYADTAACICGAPTPEGGLCRKCRARAVWQRRQAGGRRHEAGRDRRRPAGRSDTTAPRDRRSGR